VSSSRGGTIEKLYADLALAVRQKSVATATALRDEVAKHVPANPEFEDEFRNVRVSKDYLARYYLRQIERYTNGELKGLVVSSNSADVTLEHILPETMAAGWSHFDDEEHASYLYRIGNLCLLAEADNARLGNGAFADKKTAYGQSGMLLTRDVATASSWTKKQIEERSLKLASLAVKTWPLSSDMVKPMKAKSSGTGLKR
jgi:hypothetical protein